MQLMRVTKLRPCPVCGRPDWCRVHSSGRYAICNRVQSAEPARGNGWLHRLQHRLPSRPMGCSPSAVKSGLSAPLSRRHSVYSALLQLLPLELHHRQNFEQRGFSEEAIRSGGYASLPLQGRAELCRRLRRAGHDLGGIPGFYLKSDNGRSWRSLAGPPGLVVPIRDADGMVEACQVRRDDEDAGSKYAWLSTAGRPQGASSGAPAHVARPSTPIRDRRTWLTEGPLKANVTSERLAAVVIGVPGVASWRAGLDAANGLASELRHLVVAYDLDFATNLHVAAARNELIVGAVQAGWNVEVAAWNPKAKGIDDALALGLKITTAPSSPVVIRSRIHKRDFVILL